MGAILEALQINGTVMFTQLVGFALVYWCLKKFLFGPIGDMVTKRGDEIQEKFDKNEADRKEIAAAQEGYAKQGEEAKAAGEEIISEARDAAEKVRAEIIAKAETEGQEIIRKSQEKIREEKDKVVARFKEKLADLSIQAASQVLHRAIRKEDHTQIFDKYITEVDTIYEN